MDYTAYENTFPWPRRSDPDAKAKREAHSAESERLTEKFRQDFFAELGIENNPKNDMLFRNCRSIGRSFREVMDLGYDLVELIR